jgi:hypothetical protein
MSIDQAKSLLDQIKSKVQAGDTVGGNESLAEMKVCRTTMCIRTDDKDFMVSKSPIILKYLLITCLGCHD